MSGDGNAGGRRLRDRLKKIGGDLASGAFSRLERATEHFANPPAPPAAPTPPASPPAPPPAPTPDLSMSMPRSVADALRTGRPAAVPHDGAGEGAFPDEIEDLIHGIGGLSPVAPDPAAIAAELVKARQDAFDAGGVAFDADSVIVLPGEPTSSPGAIYWDPFSLVEQLGYKEKPTAITYGTLETMFWKLPVLAGLRKLRIDQAGMFCQPQRPPHEPGFRVRLCEAKRAPTPAEAREAERLERFMLTTGYVKQDRREREGLEVFVKKLLWDSLTFDQADAEIIPDRRGLPSQVNAIDASTIRLADSARLAPDDSMDSVYGVQIYNNVVVKEFTRRELVFGVRNPRTSIRAHSYGTAEAELCVSAITYLLWGMQMNGRTFSQGIQTKGLLGISGSLPDHKLKAFRREFYQMVSGVENAGRIPIMTGAEDLKWIAMQPSNRDMEFGSWMDFLIKIVSAIWSTDPIELNFKFGSQGQRGSMFDAANKMKITESKSKGLAPLLRFLERIINDNIISQINPDFVLEFTGLSPMTPKELADLETMRVRTYMTVNEIRATHDLSPLPDGLGEVINDPNWMQARRDMILVRQMEAGGVGAGDLGAGTGSPSSLPSMAPAGSSPAAMPGSTAGAMPALEPSEPVAKATNAVVIDVMM